MDHFSPVRTVTKVTWAMASVYHRTSEMTDQPYVSINKVQPHQAHLSTLDSGQSLADCLQCFHSVGRTTCRAFLLQIIMAHYYYIIERVWFMWHRLNSYKTILQCHDESHLSSSSSHAQLELYHASGKLREKSSVLSSRLKAGRVVNEIMSTGRAFQTRAAMTRKARSPTADNHDVGTAARLTSTLELDQEDTGRRAQRS